MRFLPVLKKCIYVAFIIICLQPFEVQSINYSNTPNKFLKSSVNLVTDSATVNSQSSGTYQYTPSATIVDELYVTNNGNGQVDFQIMSAVNIIKIILVNNSTGTVKFRAGGNFPYPIITYCEVEDPSNSTVFENTVSLNTDANDCTTNSATPFNCEYYAYLFQYNDVYSVDLASGSSSLVATDVTPGSINATGYNSKDGYIWGALTSPSQSIVKIGKNFQTSTYSFSELPLTNIFVGDVSLDGIYYLKSGDTYYKIDIDPLSLNYLSVIGTGTLPQSLSIHDWAFNAVDNKLYCVTKSTNRIYRIDIALNSIEDLGEVPILSGNNYTYGAVYFDLAGNFYVSSNQTGTVYIVNDVSNLSLGDSISSNIFAFGPSSSYNDGARCPTAAVPIEDCSNGVDDDSDGLVDCDDPSCSGVLECPTIDAPTSGGNNGGLESNNRLSNQLNKRKYNRIKSNYNFNKDKARILIKNDLELSRASNANYALEDFVPLGIIEEDVAIESSPLDLIAMTNATDLIAVDYQKDNKNIASILVLKTDEGVYEHTKNICDRLLGAELISVSTIEIRGQHFIKSIIKNIDGGLEFVLSFSAKESNENSFTIESHWNIDRYEENTSFYNFQIWANTPDRLLLLGNEVLNLLALQKNINGFDLSTPPPVFVKKGSYSNGVLKLNIINTNNSENILFEGNYKETETSDLSSLSSIVNLNTNYLTSIDLITGNLFDLGFRIGDGIATPDDLFMSDGPWGIDDNATSTQILDYQVNTNDYSPLDNEFLIERNPYLKATTEEYVSLYKAFSPRFTPVDLTAFNALEFKAKGLGNLEIRFIKKSIDSWENQYKTEIVLQETEMNYHIPFLSFVSNNIDGMVLNDVSTIVFTLRSEGGGVETKEISLKELKLTNSAVLSINSSTKGSLVVYPNPATHDVSLTFNSKRKQNATILIYDQLYRKVVHIKTPVYIGENDKKIDIRHLQTGFYFLQLKSDEINYKPIKLIID